MKKKPCLFLLLLMLILDTMAAPSGNVEIKEAETVEDKLESADQDTALLQNGVDDNLGTEQDERVKSKNDCGLMYRVHPKSKNMFQMFHNDKWYNHSCQPGLVYNMTNCRCEYNVTFGDEEFCGGYNAFVNETRKFLQLVNNYWMIRDCSAGLHWDQNLCRCEWPPGGPQAVLKLANDKESKELMANCQTMLNITFDDGIEDASMRSFISPPQEDAYQYMETEGSDGGSYVHLRDAQIIVWYFAGNHLGDALQIRFRFKNDNDRSNRDSFQTLFSNGCNVTLAGYMEPSISFSYKASQKMFQIQLEAGFRRVISCAMDLKPYDWHTVDLVYDGYYLKLDIDEYPCINFRGFQGQIKANQCPLTIGMDPFEKEKPFRGSIDNFTVERYCKEFARDSREGGKKKKNKPL